MKKSGFDSANADFSVANVIVELLRTKNVHEASVLRFRLGPRASSGALKNMGEPSTLQRNGETAFAISPDNADQGLRFGMLVVHRRSGHGMLSCPGRGAAR